MTFRVTCTRLKTREKTKDKEEKTKTKMPIMRKKTINHLVNHIITTSLVKLIILETSFKDLTVYSVWRNVLLAGN